VDALIFVAVVVAWAVYLIPKALSHHEESVRSRSVDRFSHRMRVLARREPVNSRNARLVLQPGKGAGAPVVTSKGPGPSPAELRARRDAARRATRRRRNVLALLLLANVTVAACAGFGLFSWWYQAIPAGLLVAWLVACRVMVRGERAALRPSAAVPADADGANPDVQMPAQPVLEAPAYFDVTRNDQGFDEVAATATTSVISATPVDPDLWDPLPVTLPTYVDAPAARRTVRTIDLDATGVWSSGRSEIDSALAREADEADRAARVRTAEAGQRATGS
jgi:hypothetical protein